MYPFNRLWISTESDGLPAVCLCVYLNRSDNITYFESLQKTREHSGAQNPGRKITDSQMLNKRCSKESTEERR